MYTYISSQALSLLGEKLLLRVTSMSLLFVFTECIGVHCTYELSKKSGTQHKTSHLLGKEKSRARESGSEILAVSF